MTKKKDWLFYDDDMMGEANDQKSGSKTDHSHEGSHEHSESDQHSGSHSHQGKHHHAETKAHADAQTQAKDHKQKEATPEHIAGQLGHPTYQELETKLTEAEMKAQENWDKYLHLQAEMENVRRRSQREVSEAHKYSVSKILEELVPILDSLDQSLTAIPETDNQIANNMREGMALTLQMFQKVMAKFGVKELNPVNEVFNPAYHEVMIAQENGNVAPNTILTVLQKGYQLHDRLIRPARVIVAKAPAKNSEKSNATSS